jgi:hypothetical protein
VTSAFAGLDDLPATISGIPLPPAMTRAILVSILALAAAVARPAHASPYGDFGINFTDTWSRGVMNAKLLNRPGGGGGAHAQAPSMQVARRAPRMPAVMAASVEPGQRAATERQYAMMLETYGKLVPKLKLGERDVSGAFALLVCAAYTAYHGEEVTDTALAATKQQLRDVLAAKPEFAKMAADKKQDMFEQAAIVSTLLVVRTEGAKADPKKRDELRELGKQLLAGFGDPDRLLVTESGITLAPKAAMP